MVETTFVISRFSGFQKEISFLPVPKRNDQKQQNMTRNDQKQTDKGLKVG